MKIDNNYLKKSWEYLSNRDYEKAIFIAEKAADENNSEFLSFYIRGISLFNLGRISESVEITKQGLSTFKNQTDLLSVLGGCLISLGDLDEAELFLKKSLAINDKNALAWAHLSWMYFNQRKYSDSLDAAARALIIQPGDSGAKCNMAGCLKEMRRVEESINLYKEVLIQNPKLNVAWVGILFTMLFSERFDLIEHSEMVSDYVTTLRDKKIPDFIEYKNINALGKIRLGILSEDVRVHPCAYMLIPFIANMDTEKVEIFVYSLNKVKDNVSKKIENLASKFVDLSNSNTLEIVNSVRSDDLDVLIDLGGYTGNSPLRYMVHKLANKQCSWLGYPASSQMKEIDYRIGDEYINITSQDCNYSEKLLKNKEIFCTYAPLVYKPLMAYDVKYAVKKPPFERNGYITFGSCNNLAKISDKTIKLWSQTIIAVSNSKIIIEADNIDRLDVSQGLIKKFDEFGVSADRIILLARRTDNQYLTYNLIDIALDTMPLTGGSTTLDCLWMGVPVVTKVGDFYHTRISGSVLNMLSLQDLISESDDEYIEKAVALARNLDKLRFLRSSLRHKFEQSPIMDNSKFTNWFLKSLQIKKKLNVEINESAGEKFYFNSAVYTFENLKKIIVILFENKEFNKLITLLENISAKWSKHWIVAFTLSEIDLLEGQFESSLYKLNIALGLNPSCSNLNKIWFERTKKIKVECRDYYFAVERKFLLTNYKHLNNKLPSFANVIMEQHL